MNNNWESLIRAIVPLSFMAIWALTSLFNRDTKAKPVTRSMPRPDGPRNGISPRPGEPTMRFASPGSNPALSLPSRRASVRPSDDDGIVILSAETNRLEREQEKRAAAYSAGIKRATRGKPLLPQRKGDPPAVRTKLAGVSQNVNQHLTNTNLELSPLASLPAMPSLGLTGSTPAAAVAVVSATKNESRSTLSAKLTEPGRLREAFILNEILQPPVSMRAKKRERP